MDRRIPRLNRVLDQKWNKKMHNKHKFNISHIKGMLDMSPPKAFNAKPLDLKGYQMIEDKYTEIERNNQRLFERMSKLLDKSNPSKFLPKSIIFKPKTKSMNKWLRVKEKIRIDLENKRMLQRMQQKKSEYDVDRLHKDRRSVEKWLKFMGEYPHTLNSDHSHSSFRSISQQRSLEALRDDRHSYLPKINHKHRNSVNHSPVNWSLINTSRGLQEDLDFFINDPASKSPQNVISSADLSMAIPEVIDENANHEISSRFDFLKNIKCVNLSSLRISNNRVPLYSKKHDFGPKVGSKHVEMSIYKNKFYIGKE